MLNLSYVQYKFICTKLYHGIATYARSDVPARIVETSQSIDPLQWISSFIEGTTTLNIYNPPSVLFTHSPQYSHLAIYVGYFNCQQIFWGYRNDTNDGTELNDSNNVDLTLLYDNRQSNYFHSGRWQSETNSDLGFTTSNATLANCVSRNAIEPCPRSHHRPSLIRHDALVNQTTCSSLPRWNYRKVRWDFTEDTRKMFTILPEPDTPDTDDAYNQFTSAIIGIAKRHTTIPGWANECDELAEKHHAATSEQEIEDTAKALLEHLDTTRQ